MYSRHLIAATYTCPRRPRSRWGIRAVAGAGIPETGAASVITQLGKPGIRVPPQPGPDAPSQGHHRRSARRQRVRRIPASRNAEHDCFLSRAGRSYPAFRACTAPHLVSDVDRKRFLKQQLPPAFSSARRTSARRALCAAVLGRRTHRHRESIFHPTPLQSSRCAVYVPRICIFQKGQQTKGAL